MRGIYWAFLVCLAVIAPASQAKIAKLCKTVIESAALCSHRLGALNLSAVLNYRRDILNGRFIRAVHHWGTPLLLPSAKPISPATATSLVIMPSSDHLPHFTIDTKTWLEPVSAGSWQATVTVPNKNHTTLSAALMLAAALFSEDERGLATSTLMRLVSPVLDEMRALAIADLAKSLEIKSIQLPQPPQLWSPISVAELLTRIERQRFNHPNLSEIVTQDIGKILGTSTEEFLEFTNRKGELTHSFKIGFKTKDNIFLSSSGRIGFEYRINLDGTVQLSLDEENGGDLYIQVNGNSPAAPVGGEKLVRHLVQELSKPEDETPTGLLKFY